MAQQSAANVEILNSLLADPDNAALHAAYADCLIEAGDPRGEYIRLLLELEERNQPSGQLAAMHERVRHLEALHGHTWFGPILQRSRSRFSLRRGWFDTVEVQDLDDILLHSITVDPAYRLLRELTILNVNPELRVHDAAETLADTLRRTAIETLAIDGWAMGDPGVLRLCRPALPPRLKRLELRGCWITDDGCEDLARAAAQLDCLKLDNNLITPIGAAHLANLPQVDLGWQRFIHGGGNPRIGQPRLPDDA